MADLPLKIIQNSQKQMPCNIEAEQALIGSILVSNPKNFLTRYMQKFLILL